MIRKSITGLLLIGFVSVLLMFATACQKKIVAPPATPAEEVTKGDDTAEQERLAREQAERDRIAREEEARARAKAEMESEKIYFDYDKSDLKYESQTVLTKKANWLKENGQFKLKIEGHCDERGSTEYNMALGARRAEAASNFISALGVSSDRLTTVSYGEEKPAVTGSGESEWSQNRRDEFILIQ